MDYEEYNGHKIFINGDGFNNTLLVAGGFFRFTKILAKKDDNEVYPFIFAVSVIEESLRQIHTQAADFEAQAQDVVRARIDQGSLVDRHEYTYQYDFGSTPPGFREVTNPGWYNQTAL